MAGRIGIAGAVCTAEASPGSPVARSSEAWLRPRSIGIKWEAPPLRRPVYGSILPAVTAARQSQHRTSRSPQFLVDTGLGTVVLASDSAAGTATRHPRGNEP